MALHKFLLILNTPFVDPMPRQICRQIALAAIIAITMTAPARAAQEANPSSETAIFDGEPVRLDTPSGLPVPRFVSLKAKKTYCRAGPSFDHPVRLTFMRKGLPVIVVAETTDHWRKIRDREGDECWTHKSKLSGVETALVTKHKLILRKKPNDRAPWTARLGEGVIVEIEKSKGDWRRVKAAGNRGWALKKNLWGAR